ncbi:hypothetical protein [Brevundimonas sp.]|uniref:hypothetical protein n=1 Tax=Brevundimonas sp. TaxID=1871086 RepID=UPI00286BFC7E|nr:hypothetical protein [Brevundimonas sp.]
MRFHIALPTIAAALFAAWGVAAQSVEPGGRGWKVAAAFNDAGPETKLIVIGLVVSGLTAAALGPWLARRTRDTLSPRGIGFVSGLRLGGPLVALMTVFQNLLNGAVASAWFNRPPSSLQLAQIYAELALIALAGTLAAAAAVFSLEHVRAAIARARQ